MPQEQLPNNPTDRTSRRWLSLLMRGVICGVAVFWLCTHTEWSQIRDLWYKANRPLLLLSVLVYGPAPLILACRLKLLLSVHDIRISLLQAIKVTFAGNFIIQTWPIGTTGGDSVKAYYIARDTHLRHEAVICVFFDRLVGLLSLVIISAVAVALNWYNPAFQLAGQGIGAVMFALIVGTFIYTSKTLRQAFRVDTILRKLPLSDHLRRIDNALLAFQHRKRLLLVCLVLALIPQLLSIFSVFLAGWALGMVQNSPGHTLLVFMGYVPMCYIAGLLPIGAMELTYEGLLVKMAGLGHPGAGVMLSIFTRIIQLFWALPGVLVILRNRSNTANDAEQPENPS